MSQVCSLCYGDGAHSPGCSEMRWPDGQLRGGNAGSPPARSITLQNELAEIFAGTTEAMIERHVREQGRKA